MAAFEGHGGICVVSCYNKKCDDMRRAVQRFGHSMCVTFIPDSEQQFALKYGGLVERYAKHASQVLVITGDNGEEGQWQKQEMQLLRREGIPFKKLTLAKYEARFGQPQAPGSQAAAQQGMGSLALCAGLTLCLASVLPFWLGAGLVLCLAMMDGSGAKVRHEREPQSCGVAATPEGCLDKLLRVAAESGSSRTLQDGTEERGFLEGEALRLGRRRLPDGAVQEGLFGGAQANSLQRGTWTDACGIVQVGTFVLGFEGRLRLQSGRMTFPSGETQDGDFFTDKELSYIRRGKVTSPDGGVAEGDFDYDADRLARGTWTFPSGLVLEGEFDVKKNVLKKGSRRHPDGRVERVG